MLKGFVDVFAVQWPGAARPHANADTRASGVSVGDRDQRVVHRGWLV